MEAPVEVHQLQAPLTAPHRIFFVPQAKVSNSSLGKVDEVDTEVLQQVEEATELLQAGRVSLSKVASLERPEPGAQAQQQRWVPTVDPALERHSTHSGLEPGQGQEATTLLSLQLSFQQGCQPSPSPKVVARGPLCTASLMEKVMASESGWGDTPLHHRLQINLAWWKKWATVPIINLIREGIQPKWLNPPRLSVQGRQGQNLAQAQKIMEEYETVGAVKRVSPQHAKHLIPWFLLSKPEEGGGTKWRFISDCREINQHFQVETFKLDHLQQIYPLLQKGSWGAKIDLKDAYFHLPVNQALRPYLCHKVGNQVWEYQAGPFGLNVMPQLFQKVMGVFEKKWRKKGVQVYIYLDDILILGTTPKLLNQHLSLVVEDLINSGFKINLKKSQMEPSQKVSHLGFLLNLQQGKLQISPYKLKGIKKELGKFVKKTTMSKRQVAAILGQIRANLLALPFLRAFTTLLVNFLAEKSGASWDEKHQLSQEIKEELKVVKTVMEKWGGRPFVSKPTKVLHSDSSDKGWGGINPHTGKFVQTYWIEESYLHINVKEMKAAINTVQSLAKANDKVLLCVDNQVIFYYLQKGGEKESLQPTPTAILALANGQKRGTPSKMGSFRKVSCRPTKQVVSRQGGLLLGCKIVQLHSTIFPTVYKFRNGSLCKPRQQKIVSICGQVATLASKGPRCPKLQLREYGGSLCQPPLVNHPKVFDKVETFPSSQSFDGRPLLGFHTMVAPINKNESPPHPLPKNHPLPRDVHKLFAGTNATPKVAPFCLICSGNIWSGSKFQVTPSMISLEEINR